MIEDMFMNFLKRNGLTFFFYSKLSNYKNSISNSNKNENLIHIFIYRPDE